MAETEHDPWSDLAADFEVHRVRIVAMLGHDGGAIVENVRRLYCREGRVYVSDHSRKGEYHSLEYEFSFGVAKDSELQLSTAVPGRIVISGHHLNGRRIEIRGSGHIGYDQGGNIEGRFDSLPAILTEDCEIGIVGIDEIEPEEDHSKRGFPLPPQFLQASRPARAGSTRRRALRASRLRAKLGK